MTQAGDIDLTGGIRIHRANLEALAQRLKIRLLLRRGEWFPDALEGIPYVELLQSKSSKGVIDLFLQEYIQETEGLTKLTGYSSKVNEDRQLEVSFSATGPTGAVETLTIGGIDVF